LKKSALDKFVDNINRIHSGIEVDFYKSSIDAMFERICGTLMRDIHDGEIWYDGTGDLTLSKSGDGSLTFDGNMHVAQGQKKHWREKFKAIVHVTENDDNYRVDVSCGDYQASGFIYTMFEDDME